MIYFLASVGLVCVVSVALGVGTCLVLAWRARRNDRGASWTRPLD